MNRKYPKCESAIFVGQAKWTVLRVKEQFGMTKRGIDLRDVEIAMGFRYSQS